MTFEATRSGFGYESPSEGKTNDWLTPPKLVEALGEFDLDPCGCRTSPFTLAKKTFYLPENDGLLTPWEGRVFCNPPYGPHVGQWANKMAIHRNGILLIFSRTETEAWKSVWAGGDAFLFPLGRVMFLKDDGTRAGSGTAPSALIAYGENNVLALKNAGIAGTLLTGKQLLIGTRISKL